MMRTEWRMAAVAAAVIAIAAACGGKGGETFTKNTGNDPDPSVSPGASGSVAVIEFDLSATDTPASDGLTLFRSQIGPVGSANAQTSLLRFRLLNRQGRPAGDDQKVVFTLNGPPDARLTLTKDRSKNGFVETVLVAGPTPGFAIVTAQVSGSDLSARSPVVLIGSLGGRPAASIEFFGLRLPGLLGGADDAAGTPESRTQLGVRGSGFQQAVDVVFAVLDDHGGAAADGTIVDFSLFGPNGGESIAPMFAASIDGFVSATITTGTRPGPVEVTALVRGTALRARAIPITIGSALNPPASHLSFAAQCFNVAGSVTFGLEDDIRAGLSDQFGNSIPIGSAVSFFSEGGGMVPQGITENGFAAHANLITQEPIPTDRRVQVMAVTTGQETFTDLNGNGQFDAGEPFDDLPQEVFLDANEDTIYELGEFFLDRNNNGVFDGTPNGIWDEQALIAVQNTIIFSGHTTIEFSVEDFFLDVNASTTITVFISDDIGSALVGTSTVAVTGENVVVSPKTFGIPDTNINTLDGPVNGLTSFTIVLSNPTDATSGAQLVEKPASVTVAVTSDTADTGTGAPTDCPGGNGTVSLTIPGRVVQAVTAQATATPGGTAPTPTPAP